VRFRVEPEGVLLKIALVPTTEDDGRSFQDNLEEPGMLLGPDGAGEDGGEPVVTDPLVPEDASIEPDDIDPHLYFHPASSQAESYRLGAEDVLDIRVFELDQLNRTVRVSGDGAIDLPLVGKIPVQGLTPEQVSARVADQLRNRYVQDPQVSIFIREFNSQRVSILGAVKQPATYPVMGRRNLLQLIADAGGLADAGGILYVFRQTGDGRSARLTVPLTELLINGDPRWNIWIQPGDVISVPPEAAISISILGAVINPGIHKLPAGKEATLLKAIALAGGLNERASKSGIQIKRQSAKGDETLVKVDLDEILSGKKPDILLKEGDVVIVKESFF
jgi:polysaccharide export outer membrane protein